MWSKIAILPLFHLFIFRINLFSIKKKQQPKTPKIDKVLQSVRLLTLFGFSLYSKVGVYMYNDNYLNFPIPLCKITLQIDFVM